MIKQKQLVPKRRFEGFYYEWDEQILGETVEITMGQSPASASYTDNPSHNILVQGNADLKNNKVVPRVWTTEITKKACKNDLILSVRAPVGDIGKTDYDVVLGRGVAGIKGSEFVYQLLTKMNSERYWENLSTGSTFESINSADIFSANILMPDSKEQQKIGQFFKHLDEMIALEQRKIDKTKALKSAYLAEMFPAEGERVPKRRFLGFTDEWEKRTINEISLNILAGGDIDRSKISDKGKYPVLANALTNDGIVGYYQNEYRVKAPAVTVTGRGDVGHAQVREVNFTPVVRLLSIKTNHDVYFLEHSINNYRGFFESTGVPQLTVPKLGDYEIYFPSSLKEEYLIGRYFKKIDSIITNNEQKLDKLKATKQAYLHEMFV